MALSCTSVGFQFVSCKSNDADGSCASNMCGPVDFESILVTYPESIQTEYMMAQAFATTDDPEFCGFVEEGICSNYEADTCCCSDELLAWQKCLLNSGMVEKPCTVDCPNLAMMQELNGGDDFALDGGESGGGGGSMMIIIVVITILALVGGGGFYIYRRKRMAHGKVGGDSEDDDQNKPQKTGFFSLFRFKSDGSITPPGSATEERDDKSKKSRNSRRSYDRKDKNRTDFPNDIEQSGILSDVSLLEDETSRMSRASGNRHRYNGDDDEGSFSNNNKKKYGESKKNRNPRGRDRRQRSKYDHGSNVDNFEDEDSVVSEIDPRDLEPRNSSRARNNPSRNYRSASSQDGVLPAKIQSTRKISSRDLKNILKDQAESSRRLNFMEEEVMTLEERLTQKDRQAAELRLEHEEQKRRIQELEALNARLQVENPRSSASCSSSSRSRNEDYSNPQGHVSRSKASMGDDNYSEQGRSRSGIGADSDHSSYGNRGRRHRSRSGSNRNLGRSGSNRSLGRSGPSRPTSRSPSSSRGLGKQSSHMRRREMSRERDRDTGKSSKQRREISRERESRGKSSNRRHGRSKSPRNYL